MSRPVPVHIGPRPAPSPTAVTPGVGPVTDKSLEVDDPYELIGVSVPLAPGVDADRELARAFVEEFALSGWSPARIAQLFAEPTNGKAHEIWQRRGAALIDEVIGEVFGPAAAIDGIER